METTEEFPQQHINKWKCKIESIEGHSHCWRSTWQSFQLGINDHTYKSTSVSIGQFDFRRTERKCSLRPLTTIRLFSNEHLSSKVVIFLSSFIGNYNTIIIIANTLWLVSSYLLCNIIKEMCHLYTFYLKFTLGLWKCIADV